MKITRCSCSVTNQKLCIESRLISYLIFNANGKIVYIEINLWNCIMWKIWSLKRNHPLNNNSYNMKHLNHLSSKKCHRNHPSFETPWKISAIQKLVLTRGCIGRQCNGFSMRDGKPINGVRIWDGTLKMSGDSHWGKRYAVNCFTLNTMRRHWRIQHPPMWGYWQNLRAQIWSLWHLSAVSRTQFWGPWGLHSPTIWSDWLKIRFLMSTSALISGASFRMFLKPNIYFDMISKCFIYQIN